MRHHYTKQNPENSFAVGYNSEYVLLQTMENTGVGVDQARICLTIREAEELIGLLYIGIEQHKKSKAKQDAFVEELAYSSDSKPDAQSIVGSTPTEGT